MRNQTTCLRALLQACTPQERERLAALSGTPVGYLNQLAGCHRDSPRADKAFAIEDASRILHQETGGRTPIVTGRDIATMCATQGLDR